MFREDVIPTADKIADMLSQIFECQLNNLPIELFAHQFSNWSSTKETFQCIQQETGNNTMMPLFKCLTSLHPVCHLVCYFIVCITRVDQVVFYLIAVLMLNSFAVALVFGFGAKIFRLFLILDVIFAMLQKSDI